MFALLNIKMFVSTAVLSVSWGRSSRDMIAGLTHKLDPGIGGSSPLSLECVFHLPSPLPDAPPRIQPWDNNVVMRPFDYVCDWTQLSLYINFFKILAVGVEIYLTCGHPRQVFYVSCLLNLPLTNLEWSTSFLGLYLPSEDSSTEYQDQFQVGSTTTRLQGNSVMTWIKFRNCRELISKHQHILTILFLGLSMLSCA